ncbi:MAG: hypothetical protein ACREB3_00555, partial [Burkholderiales bacterium]
VFIRTAMTGVNGVEREYMTLGRIQSTGLNVNFDRAPFCPATPACTGVTIRWFVVSMTDGIPCTAPWPAAASCVLSGLPPTVAVGTSFLNAALSPAIVPSRSVPIISMRGDPASAADGALDENSWTACFGTGAGCTTATTTNLRFDRERNGTTSTLSWFVVQFASQVSVVDRREAYP